MKKFGGANVLTPAARVRGGVKVRHNKNTAILPAVRIPIPDKVVLPMSQHIGAPCVPTVKVGDTVAVGQVIGDSDAFVSCPIHASISGTVTAIGDVKLANGRMSKAVTIQSDGEMRLWEGIKPPVVTNRQELLAAVRASGLVGLGGAGFPTHVKIGFDESKGVDTLVVNAAECEPYITVDSRECVDNTDNIFKGIDALMKYLGFKKCVIAVEDNKPASIRFLSNFAKNYDNVDVMVLESKYPQGAEKMMVLSATGRKVAPGKLPADAGCVVMNVASVAFIGRYLETGKPLISRSMTVDGTAIAVPKNVRVPIGISVQEVVNFCGGFSSEPYKIIAGGPMMGAAIVRTDVPVLKSNNAILAFADDKSKIKPERACIHCGRCANGCPIGLAPLLIVDAVKTKNADDLEKLGVNVCMECGSCSYSCPSGLQLVQYMRMGKQILKEEAAKKNG